LSAGSLKCTPFQVRLFNIHPLGIERLNFEGAHVHIHGSLSGSVDRISSSAHGATYASANHVRADEAWHGAADVEAAHSTALSALRNERFGLMLAKISEPAAGGALMTMKRESGTADADFNSVASSYAENGE